MYMYPIIDTNVQVQLPHVHTTMYKIITINMYEVHVNVQAERPAGLKFDWTIQASTYMYTQALSIL